MQNRPALIAAIAFALGVVTTFGVLLAFSVPGRAIRSLQQENKILREMIGTMEMERAEVKAIVEGK